MQWDAVYLKLPMLVTGKTFNGEIGKGAKKSMHISGICI
jgi:hypothetical protein